MAFKIISKDKPTQITALKICLYGEPGVGKTTLAASIGNCILLDTNKGAHRKAFPCETIEINTWQDIEDSFEDGTFENIAREYSTFAIDTAEDFLTRYLGVWLKEKNGPRYQRNKFDYYMDLKTYFEQTFAKLTALGLNIVFICHQTEEKNKAGHQEVFRAKPKLTGGSYDVLMGDLDLLGYMYVDSSKRRIIDFNSTSSYYGKNAGGLRPQILPDIMEEGGLEAFQDFGTGLLTNTLEAINGRATEQSRFIAQKLEEAQERKEMLELWFTKVDELKPHEVPVLNEYAAELKDKITKNPIMYNERFKKEVFNYMLQHAQNNQGGYNKQQGFWTDAKVPNEEAPAEQEQPVQKEKQAAKK